VNRTLFAITLAAIAATSCAGSKRMGEQYRNSAGEEGPAGYPVYSPFPSARYLPDRAISLPASRREGDGPELPADRSRP
jgi:hypothetical protein